MVKTLTSCSQAPLHGEHHEAVTSLQLMMYDLGQRCARAPLNLNHGFPHAWISHNRFKTQDLKRIDRRNLSDKERASEVRTLALKNFHMV